MKTIDEYLSDISGIVSFIYLLNMCSNIKDFREWIKNYYSIDDQTLFKGYKFLIEVINNRIIDEIDTNSSLNLETDLIFERAESHGVNIDDIPNSCEKIIFLKNLWNILKKTRESDNWINLEGTLKDVNKKLEPFNLIFKNYTSTKNDENKRQVLKIASIINVHLYLNDTHRGSPLLFPAPLLNYPYFKHEFEEIFIGYAYGLEYIWFKLLGSKKFRNSSVKSLHHSKEMFSGKESHFYSSENAIGLFSDKERECVSNWQCFDQFFPIINQEIVEPLTSGTKSKSRYLTLKSNYNKKIFNDLLKINDLIEPIYISNPQTTNDKFKQISFYFYWYQTDYLDADILSTNGYPAFSAALIGEIQKHEIYKVKDPVQVIRIKHQVDQNKYDYSYSILFSLPPSIISDYSGWLTFCRVGTDYSGSGGYQHKITEDLIEKFENKSKISVKEVFIDLDIFKSYLGEENNFDVDGEAIKIFISYAGEERQIADEIAKNLKRRGINVWYDKFSLKIGDSTRISIDKAIRESNFAILILSNSYFSKKWPQRELTAILVNEEIKNTKILPIWHEITKDEVARKSSLLADLIAIKTSEGLDHVIREILKVVEPSNRIISWDELPD